MSFRKKIMYSFGLILLVSVMVLLLLFGKSYHQGKTMELEHMREANGQMSLNSDTMLSDVDSFRYIHFTDDKIRNLLYTKDREIDEKAYEKSEEELGERLKLLVNLGKYTLRASLVTTDGRSYSNTDVSQEYIDRMASFAKKKKWERNKEIMVGSVRKEQINLVPYTVVSIVSPVWGIMEREPLAYLYVDMDFRKIKNQWKRTEQISKSFEFMIMNEVQIYYDTNQETMSDEKVQQLKGDMTNWIKEGKTEGVLLVHGKRCMTSMLRDENTGLYFIQYYPTVCLMKRILSGMWLSWTMILIVLAITATGVILFVNRVSRPLVELSKVMGEAARTPGEKEIVALYQTAEPVQNDEVGQMINSYNEMAKRINDKIMKEYVYQLRQKQTELRMLQFQINPHFLYNALNTISSIAELQDVEYIPEIATCLSEMFRYNISSETCVALGRELKQMENYAAIQKIRFPERFELDIQVDASIREDCYVLKFILQPVVENAYKYAFTKKGKKDRISIWSSKTEDGDLLLMVQDNGIGMSEEKTAELNTMLKKEIEPKENARIGLRNVNARIKNYYGEKYGIQVESCPGSFTRVTIRLKVLSRKEIEEQI